ncbi:Unannotated [Lentimonas sp. CC19]|nr:Unannotated [Lentimonas sp. CC19]CAA6695743.1 Unannotated [Lentimonas sp. CC10]CAA7069574.1 Unannotated [Lentimonas sp. CC11]
MSKDSITPPEARSMTLVDAGSMVSNSAYSCNLKVLTPYF